MKTKLLNLLRCPKTGQVLSLESGSNEGNEVENGWLVTENGDYRYPIIGGIPRFVPKSNYADNFGMQWNYFRKTQLDSCSGIPISEDRFWLATNWKPEQLRDKWVLDVGCGAGRFAEIALKAGAKVVALDYSGAVDACYANLKHFDNLHVVQGDIYFLPLKHEVFQYVYSLGVLQHTPDVRKAFLALPQMVCKGGNLCVDYYWKRFRTLMHAKYLFRPITKRMNSLRLFKVLEQATPNLLAASQTLARVPFIGLGLKRLIPVADYTGIFPLNEQQLREWALLDTFDMLAPAHDNPQTEAIIRKWSEDAGLLDIQIGHWGHLVARGRKPE